MWSNETVAAAADDVRELDRAFAGAGAVRAGDGRRLRVLLLDAHDVVHWGFKMLLGGERWVERFMAAHGPDGALELARRHAPHVAVVDLAAVGSPGDLYARLREASPGTRVLLMSAGERISARKPSRVSWPV